MNLYKGMVYIYGRMGDFNHALQLIITKIQDVEFAIKFVESLNESEIFMDLFNKSFSNEKFLSELIDPLINYIDPMILVDKIPPKMRIEGLKMKLVRIINDYTHKMMLQNGCLSIFHEDSKKLTKNLIISQNKGLKITPFSKCVICQSAFSYEECISFFCSHIFHISCFKNAYFSGEDQEQEQILKRKTMKGNISMLNEKVLFNGRKVNCIICNEKQKENNEKIVENKKSNKKKSMYN